MDLFVAADDYDRLQRPSFSGPVDLHRGCPQLADRTWDSVVERAERVAVDGVEVRIPCREDHLRLICLHALKHGAERPMWLCDVAVLLEDAGSLDWDRVLFGDARATDWVVRLLDAAHVLLDARRPEPCPWGSARAPAWMLRAIQRAWERPFTARAPMRYHFARPATLPAAVLRHWPNPIEAAFCAGAGAGDFAPWRHQLSEAVRRGIRVLRSR